MIPNPSTGSTKPLRIRFAEAGLIDVAYLHNFTCANAEQRLTALYRTIKQ